MTFSFNPMSSSVSLDEFTGGTVNVSIINSEEEEFEILNYDGTFNPNAIYYIHPIEGVFHDMVINYDIDSFSFSSEFWYAFHRLTRYTYEVTNVEKQYLEVQSPHLLPPYDLAHPWALEFKGVYEIRAPSEDTVMVPWYIQGRKRMKIVESGEWGVWMPHTAEWWLTLNLDHTQTIRVIREAVKMGEGYKTTILTRPEVILD